MGSERASTLLMMPLQYGFNKHSHPMQIAETRNERGPPGIRSLPIEASLEVRLDDFLGKE